MKPVIGILYCGFLTQGFERQSIYVTSSYLSAVEVSGGLPVVIPYFSDFNYIANYIKLFDGILFCGGDENLARIGDTPITKQIPSILHL